MQQIPPNPSKRGGGRPTPGDANASLFNAGLDAGRPVAGDPATVTRRAERGKRIAGDLRRAVFFAAVLVFVAIVIYEFISMTGFGSAR